MRLSKLNPKWLSYFLLHGGNKRVTKSNAPLYFLLVSSKKRFAAAVSAPFSSSRSLLWLSSAGMHALFAVETVKNKSSASSTSMFSQHGAESRR